MHIFVIITAVIAAHNVANQTGKITFVGVCVPREFLIASTVVGISCKDAVFNIINIAIEFEIVRIYNRMRSVWEVGHGNRTSS